MQDNKRNIDDDKQWLCMSCTEEPFTGDHLHRAIFLDDKSQLERILDSGSVDVIIWLIYWLIDIFIGTYNDNPSRAVFHTSKRSTTLCFYYT